MKNYDSHIQKLGTLPLVKYYMDQLGLYDIFQDSLYSAKQAKTHPAEGLCILIANIVSSAKPLYLVDDWLSDYSDGLEKEENKVSPFNDDFLAGCLDKLYQADRGTLMTQISAQAIKVHELETQALHNDTTSISVYGAYNGHQEDTLQLKHGYNKDGRPEHKQLVFGLTVTDDGFVPIHYKGFDGNQTDDKTHIGVWKELRSFLKKEDFIYVADSKLASIDNMTTLASYGGQFISMLPRTRTETTTFRETLMSGGIKWEKGYSKQNSRKKNQLDVYKIYDKEISAEGYRLIWVHSSQKAVTDASWRKKSLKVVGDKLDGLSKKLNRYYLKTHEAITSAVSEITKGKKEFFNVSITKTEKILTKKKGSGRTGNNSEYIDETIIEYSLSWNINEKAVESKSHCDGIFPLITNTSLDSVEVLLQYKKQPYLEKRHSTLKSILNIAPVYLKKESRIEAVLFLYFVALMIVSLIERRIRKRMKDENIEKLPLQAKKMKTSSPTWNNINYLFRNVYLAVIKKNEKTVGSTVKGMSALHYFVLDFLNVPVEVYSTVPNDDWWRFG